MNKKATMIVASTICGRISPVGFASIKDRRLLESIRDQTDASIMGAGTLRDADPEMRCTGGRLPENRIRAFVSASGNIPNENRKIFINGPKPVIFVPFELSAELEKVFEDKAVIKGVSRSISESGQKSGISISEVFGLLSGMGAEKILVEGGGSFNYSCLKEGLIDEVLLTIAPFISGDKWASTVADSKEKISSLVKLELVECSHSGETGEIFTKYRVIK
ncbi:RibD family protein [Desulforegula conservatrix]|uniref:RibD family protein n=1 Tax=Desulforegula conservatrix TaxID=153026 RepID=UPI00040BC68A|nr:dihydrofolate reductase family protein [Desulforegula conservatrix]